MPVSDLNAASQRLLEGYGEAIVLRQKSVGTYSTSTRSYSGESDTTFDLYGFVSPVDDRSLNGTSVIRGDLVVRLSGNELRAFSATPVVGDFIERAGNRYRIESIEHRYAGGSELLVVCQIRGVN